MPPTLKFWMRLVWVILAFLAFIIFASLILSKQSPEPMTYGYFLTKLDQGEVTRVVIHENNLETSGKITEIQLEDGKHYEVDFPLYLHPGLVEELDVLAKSGVPVIVKSASTFSWFSLLFMVGILALIFLFFSKAAGQQGKSAKLFAKANAKEMSKVRERFSDVAGIDEAREELEDIVDFLMDPEKYEKLGAKIPRGVLLVGPPGTGKTLLARAIAGEAGVPFFSISASEFVEMFVGVGAARVRNLFRQAKQSAPSIVFIDEIDAVGRRRGSGLGNAHDEREQTLNQIFVEMDGFDQTTNVIVLAATNRPDILDPALLRPKRFDRKVIIDKPDVKGREKILAVHTKDKPLADDVNLESIARALPGVTGAELENLANETAIIAAKRGESVINNSCFQEAADKILMGKGRKLVMDESERKLIAFHEAGHAAVAKSLPGTDPVRKISITARGRSLGQTLTLPEKDRYIFQEPHLLNLMRILLGGRAVEEVLLHTKSTGAEDDLRKTKEIVQKMVCSWGMSELGPRIFGEKEEEVFLGMEINRRDSIGSETLKKIDDEETRIIFQAYEAAKSIILENKEKVESLVHALLGEETLEQGKIDALWNKT